MVLTKRLMRELQEIKTKPLPPGITLVQAESLEEWHFHIEVPNPLYAGKVFRIRLRFVGSYPLEAPETVFVTTGGYEAPQMAHCYENGHVCASILGSEWSPVLNAQSVLITLQSMLASSKKLERPPDNSRYIRTAPVSPKDTKWVYHDDNC
ncbi:unnamed protein product [Tilletia controversa]|uniref:UBC core domain-containing protein n=3 Tax=Tilletia TaxID=13289 RepID=A0A8X7SYH5_9BASI|nr:hypothetical protein CF336_g2565 [Tilletia laevis]KAE8202145.1 hypothetical protein CF328_g2380 [Tilletia controversa]KAE8262971.1 hypothetical protein A4X03_0g2029 [Tilletia caries]KAE8206611.1 hypothetical protein CF335_g1751 [Tilletia laevis]KAE8249760.1 hypothetical protein A4X06_0g3083 [Tilletia controversa]